MERPLKTLLVTPGVKKHILGLSFSLYPTGAPFCYLSISRGHSFLIHAKTLRVPAATQAVETIGSLRLATYLEVKKLKPREME